MEEWQTATAMEQLEWLTSGQSWQHFSSSEIRPISVHATPAYVHSMSKSLHEFF